MIRFLPLLALFAHLVLGTAYLMRTPAFEAPDENDHYKYASFVAQTGRLPIVLGTEGTTGHSHLDAHALGHHPPLYYGLLAATLHAVGAADTIPSWRDNPLWQQPAPPGLEGEALATHRRAANLKWRHGADEFTPVSAEIDTLRLLRAWSVACGAVTLVLLWLLGRLLLPGRPVVVGMAMVGLACLPQWSATHGVLDNGNLATTVATGVLVLLAVALRRPDGAGAGARLAATTGLLLGLALVTKLTALFLVPLVAMTLLLAPQGAGRWRRGLVAAAVAGAVALAIAGWFFWRNHALYGEWLGSGVHRVAFASNVVPPEKRLEYLLGRFWTETLWSLVGIFGWSAVRLPVWVVGIPVALVLGALVGAVRARHARERHVRPRGGLPLLLGAAGLTAALLVQFNVTFYQPQGRYLFPGLPAAALLLAWGLAGLGQDLHRGATRTVPGTLAIVCVLAGMTAHHMVFRPGFHPLPPLATGDAEATPEQRARAALVAGVASPAAPAMQLVTPTGPDDGARLETAPTFTWTPPEGTPDTARFTLHVYTEAGEVLFATFEWFEIAVGAGPGPGSWTLPDVGWHALPVGVPMRWKVRMLPDRTRGLGVTDVPESPPRTLVRVR